MAFDQNKPANNAPLVSADLRNNLTHIKGVISKEHTWDDNNPANTVHRLDQINIAVTGSTQRDICRDLTEGQPDYKTGKGDLSKKYEHTTDGVAGNVYSLQSLLQELVNRSHKHVVEERLSNCNCNCSTDH